MIILIFSIYWKFSQFYPKRRYFSQFQRLWPHSQNTQRRPWLMTCCQQRAFFFLLRTALKPLNWIWRKLIESKISMSSTKFVFFGAIRKPRYGNKCGTLYSGARYVALWASCLVKLLVVVTVYYQNYHRWGVYFNPIVCKMYMLGILMALNFHKGSSLQILQK